MTRAKFYCVNNEPTDAHDFDQGRIITLNPVVTGSKVNEEFYKLTPAGQIILSTVNTATAQQFEVGKEYYVTFERAGE